VTVVLLVLVGVLVLWDIVRTLMVKDSFAQATARIEAHLLKLKGQDESRNKMTEAIWDAINQATEGQQAARDKFAALCKHLGVQNIELRKVEHTEQMRVIGNEWVVVESPRRDAE
jgi:hypothetical protein